VAMLQVTDWYPVKFQAEGRTYPKARVVVTAQGRAVVWAWVDKVPTKVEDATAVEAVQNKRELTVTTESEEWNCIRQGSCGCRDKIRDMRLRQLLA
jgi:hypothetical protein